MKITQDLIRSLFQYDPNTGTFLRTHKISYIGNLYPIVPTAITHTNQNGYYRTSVYRRLYLVHRLIFIYMTGRQPKKTDHINGNKQDNRWANLRDVDQASNMLNMGLRYNSITGEIGISRNRQGKYVVLMQRDGQQRYGGRFPTLEEAIAARNRVASELGFHPNHGARPSWRG